MRYSQQISLRVVQSFIKIEENLFFASRGDKKNEASRALMVVQMSLPDL